MSLRFGFAIALLSGLVAAGGMAIAQLPAQEQVAPSKTLMPGKDSDLTTARCIICHDATHITRTRLSRAEWAENLQTMIARGMPIAPEEIPRVVEYLATYYNRDVAPPPPAKATAAAPAMAGTAAVPAADPVQKLLAINACTACHALDQKLVGPGFREIARRYRGDGNAAAKLARKIREGGAGAWGPTPMPPHQHLGEADVRAMASWVLQQN